MAKFIFLPTGKEVGIHTGCKVLIAARQGKVAMRYGCVSCRCGTCAVRVDRPENLQPMADDERELLKRMKLPTGGSIRLGCQAKIADGTVTVDLDFQQQYSPDSGLLDG